jgi:hypothetical protein
VERAGIHGPAHEHEEQKMIILKPVVVLGLVLCLLGCSDQTVEPFYPDSQEAEEPGITLTRPGADTIGPNDTILEIKWKTMGDVGDYVSISLYEGGEYFTGIAVQTYNDGYYAWRIHWNVEFSHQYQIKIVCSTDESVYDFSDFFSIIPDSLIDSYEPDDSIRTANVIDTLPFYQDHALTGTDRDMFILHAEAGATYVIETMGDVSHKLALYDRDSTLMWSQSGSSSRDTLQLIWTCLSGGDYYVLVHESNSSYYKRHYTISILYGTAPSIKVILPDSSTVWNPGGSDTIQWIYKGSAGNEVDIRLYNGDQSAASISYGTRNDGEMIWTWPITLDSGSFYRIKVTSHANLLCYGYSDFFEVTLPVNHDAYEPDSIPDLATHITVDGSSQNHTLPTGDVDWFQFTAIEGVTYIVNTGLSNYDTWLSLYSTDKTTLLAENDDGDYYKMAMLIWTCPATGTYYFKVREFSGTVFASYTVSVASGSLPFITVTSPASGDSLIAGWSSTLRWISSGSMGKYYNVELFREDSFLVTLLNYTSAEYYKWKVPASLDTSSRYRIKVKSTVNDSCYDFSPYFSILSQGPDDIYEPDDSLSQSTRVDTFGTVQHHTLLTNDIDWFTFDAVQGNTYIIGASGTIDNLSLYLYGTDGSTLLASDRYDESVKLTWTCPESGPYYFKITSAYEGLYSVVIYD